jgi:hypothetical protein
MNSRSVYRVRRAFPIAGYWLVIVLGLFLSVSQAAQEQRPPSQDKEAESYGGEEILSCSLPVSDGREPKPTPRLELALTAGCSAH